MRTIEATLAGLIIIGCLAVMGLVGYIETLGFW